MKTDDLKMGKIYMYNGDLVRYTGIELHQDFKINVYRFLFVKHGFGLEITKKRIESGVITNCN